MHMLTRRLQILLDDDRYERLAHRARQRGTSVATLVREAIDAAFPVTDSARREAAGAVLAADPMDVPGVAALKAEIAVARGGRR